MATIKINELPTSSINSTDFLVKADGNGLATKNTVENLLVPLAKLEGGNSFTGIQTVTNTANTSGINAVNENNGFGINSLNKADGSGIYVTNKADGTGIYVINEDFGTGAYLLNLTSGDGLVLDSTGDTTGLSFVVKNNGLNSFTIDKEGNVIANTFVGNGSGLTNLQSDPTKADLNGNISELFEVSNGLSANDAINKTQLDGLETSLQSNIDLKIDIASIVDNVTAGGSSVPLSAEQGKVLKAEILALAGSLIPQGNWDADTNTPDISGTTETGYFWIVSVEGATDIGGITDWKVNDWVIKTADGFAKIDNTDKVLSVAGKIGEVVLAKADVGLSNVDNTTDANKPISTAQQTDLDLKLNKNNSITGATKTKITYDAKGLVSAGEDATTNDIAESTDKKYVTDAQLTILGNTTNTNSGDNTVNSSSASTAQGELADSASQATGVEDNATADQTGAEIKTAYEAETNAYTDTKNTKLDGIEANADVTDATNVAAAGALMDSEITNLAQVKAFDSSDYATSANLDLKANKASPSFTGDAEFGGNVDVISSGDTYLNISSTNDGRKSGLKLRQSSVFGIDLFYNDSTSETRGLRFDVVKDDVTEQAFFIERDNKKVKAFADFEAVGNATFGGSVTASSFVGAIEENFTSLTATHTLTDTDYNVHNGQPFATSTVTIPTGLSIKRSWQFSAEGFDINFTKASGVTITVIANGAPSGNNLKVAGAYSARLVATATANEFLLIK